MSTEVSLDLDGIQAPQRNMNTLDGMEISDTIYELISPLEDIKIREKIVSDIGLSDVIKVDSTGIHIINVISFKLNDWGKPEFSPATDDVRKFAGFLRKISESERISLLTDVLKFHLGKDYQTDEVDGYIVWTYFFEPDGCCTILDTPYSPDFLVRESC